LSGEIGDGARPIANDRNIVIMMGRKKKRSMLPAARHPIVPQTMATTTTSTERKMPPSEISQCYTPNYFITTLLTIKMHAAVSLWSILN
jgi:hypothetical protein